MGGKENWVYLSLILGVLALVFSGLGVLISVSTFSAAGITFGVLGITNTIVAAKRYK